jgi:hypothetical protein
VSELVPVKTWLKAATYRAYEHLARQRGTEVGVLLALQADKSLEVRHPVRRTRADSALRNDRIRELHASGLSDQQIGKVLGITGQAVSLRRRKLGLERNYPPFGKQA